MKIKLAILMVYVLGLAAFVVPRAGALETPAQASASGAPGPMIKLDTKRKGARGVVYFAHSDYTDERGYRYKGHENLLYPANIEADPDDYSYNFQEVAKSGAACVGCHHTRSDKGIPQMWKCTACHKGEGNNEGEIAGEKVVNREGDEMHAERAFHDMCIGCHKANYQAKLPKPGPTTCGGCHKQEQ